MTAARRAQVIRGSERTILGFYALPNQSAEGFVDLVGLLKDAGFDINKCRG